MSDTTETEPHAGEPDVLVMGTDPYERNWMRFSVVLLLAFFATISVAGFAMGIQVNGADAEVDPRVVTDSGPWAEPGVREISEGEYEAWVIAQTWAFVPREITIPVGAKVEIHVTSPDLQHGFKITDTNVNMQIVPGQVSTMSYTFDEVGEFPYICHEYCGTGHAAMFGVVNVVSQSEFDAETGSATASDGEVEQ